MVRLGFLILIIKNFEMTKIYLRRGQYYLTNILLNKTMSFGEQRTPRNNLKVDKIEQPNVLGICNPFFTRRAPRTRNALHFAWIIGALSGCRCMCILVPVAPRCARPDTPPIWNSLFLFLFLFLSLIFWFIYHF